MDSKETAQLNELHIPSAPKLDGVCQSALHGLLQQLRDVGLQLVSVASVDTDQPHLTDHRTSTGAQPSTQGNDMTVIDRTTPTRQVPTSRVPMGSPWASI
jgi:hypothetical protein